MAVGRIFRDRGHVFAAFGALAAAAAGVLLSTSADADSHPTVGPAWQVFDLAPPGTDMSEASMISGRGHVLVSGGDAPYFTRPRAYLYGNSARIAIGLIYPPSLVLNDSGEVFGTRKPDGAAFRWRNGRMTVLSRLTALAFNSSGDFGGCLGGDRGGFRWHAGKVTAFPPRAGREHACVVALGNDGSVFVESWSPDKTTLDSIVGHLLTVWKNGNAIDLGSDLDPRVVRPGRVLLTEHLGGPKHPVVWAGGQLTPVFPRRARFVRATAMNDKGEVAGYDAGTRGGFLWRSGSVRTFPAPGGPGAHVTWAHLNNRGHVVFNVAVPGNPNALVFVWRDGRMTPLPTLGGKSSYANAINDYGTIVGWTETDTGQRHAALWRRMP